MDPSERFAEINRTDESGTLDRIDSDINWSGFNWIRVGGVA